MANQTHSRRCKVCDWLIPVKRLRRHPFAVLCSSPDCTIEHRRRRHARAQHNWIRGRSERDPEFHERERARARERYGKRQAAKVAVDDSNTK